MSVRRSVSLSVAAARTRWSLPWRWIAGILTGALLAGCSWPLARSHPLAGACAAAVTIGYVCVAYLSSGLDRRLARWLFLCAALWAGSTADALPSAAMLAAICWVALWLTLAAGVVAAGRGVPGRMPGRARTARQDDTQRALNRGFPPQVRLAAASSAGTVVAASLAIAVAAYAGHAWAWARWWPGSARSLWAVAVQEACAVAVPVVIAAGAWRRRWARAGVSALLTQLATPPTAEGVQAVLRTALGDPTAAVFYRLPDVPGFISTDGEQAELPVGETGRLVFPAAGSDGKIAALLTVDKALGTDAGRIQVALVACGPALENAGLQAVLQGQLREARASRTRIVQTAMAERRSLARNLHDGAQQHLLVLLTRLGMARQATSEPQSLAAIDAARDQLRAALSKLRGLSRDIYPSVLDTEGLTAALESLADDGPLDVELASTAGQLDPQIEIVAYLTVRDILDGLAQYAGATQAKVAVIARNDQLTVQVASDGTLGQRTGMPPWLANVTDRIRANEGDLSVRFEPGPVGAQEAVWVEAWIPCG